MAKETKTATIELTGDINVVVVDGYLVTAQPYDSKDRLSASGKNTIHATTGGNKAISINGEVHMYGSNLYKKK